MIDTDRTSKQNTKHERRVVGHASGWKEQMDTCVCGKPWPCSEVSKGGSKLQAYVAKDVLSEVRQAAHDLGNDPPNGITTMRALTALQRAAGEIERLTNHDHPAHATQSEVEACSICSPFETTAVDPFDHAAIMADPGNRRISMRFETQEQYEAALTFLDMADGPEDVTLNNIAVKCSQCQYAGVAAKWGGQCPVCHAKL